jgi:isopenicillin-N N-acyltransferase-like protein
MNVPSYRFSGSHRTMGRQHGEELREVIRSLATERIDMILSGCRGVGGALVQSVSEEAVSEIRAQVPEVYEEARGVAEGAGLDVWELVVAGGYSDIEHRVADVGGIGGSQLAGECTLVAARGQDGQMLLAGTWDSHASALSALAIVERHPESGPATLALTTAGWPIQQGLNSNGLALAIANLVPISSTPGIPYIAALPRIAARRSAVDGELAARELRLCSGRYYALVDDSGAFVGIETDGHNYESQQTPRAHTNHYIFEKTVTWEGRPKYATVSEDRRRSAERRLAESTEVTAESLLSLLRFHDGTSNSILQMGEGRATRTGVCYVLAPAERKLFYATDPSQKGETKCVRLGQPT